MRALFRHRRLLALAFAVSAPGQRRPTAGVYVANRMETATALELAADGRFVWVLSMAPRRRRARPLARRRRRPLDSDPVMAPSFEIVRTEPADRVVRIRFDADRAADGFVDVELEYADGARSLDHLRGTGYAIALGGERPVAFRRQHRLQFSRSVFRSRRRRFAHCASGPTISAPRIRGRTPAVAADGLTSAGAARRCSMRASVRRPVRRPGWPSVAARGRRGPGRRGMPPPPPSEPGGVGVDAVAGLIDYVLDEPFPRPSALHLVFPDRLGGERARRGPASSGSATASMTSVASRGSDGASRGERANGSCLISAQDRMLALGEALTVPARSVPAPGRLRKAFRKARTAVPADRSLPLHEHATGWDEVATILADEDQGIQAWSCS